jgi:hypothetical protein
MVYSDEKRGEALTDNIVDAIPQEVNASAAVPTTP